MTVAEQTKPLEVELWVCPTCHLVSKLVDGRGPRYHGFCTGPSSDDHKRQAMKLRRFREVRDD